MFLLLRNRVISVAAGAWVLAVRARRVVTNLFQPRLRAIDHVTIPVRDLEAATRFYVDVLGATFFMRVDDETFARFGRPPAPDGGDGAHHISLLVGGSTRLDIFYQTGGQGEARRGHPHFAFRVPPRDLMKWKSRLAKHGVPSDGPLQLGFPGQASLYFNDPSGNHLEIVTTGFGREIPIRAPDMKLLEWAK